VGVVGTVLVGGENERPGKWEGVMDNDGLEDVAKAFRDYRNEYYNSKEGRLHDEQAAAEATAGGSVRA